MVECHLAAVGGIEIHRRLKLRYLFCFFGAEEWVVGAGAAVHVLITGRAAAGLHAGGYGGALIKQLGEVCRGDGPYAGFAIDEFGAAVHEAEDFVAIGEGRAGVCLADIGFLEIDHLGVHTGIILASIVAERFRKTGRIVGYAWTYLRKAGAFFQDGGLGADGGGIDRYLPEVDIRIPWWFAGIKCHGGDAQGCLEFEQCEVRGLVYFFDGGVGGFALPLDHDGLFAGDYMEGGDDAVGQVLGASAGDAIAGGFIGVDLDDGVFLGGENGAMEEEANEKEGGEEWVHGGCMKSSIDGMKIFQIGERGDWIVSEMHLCKENAGK